MKSEKIVAAGAVIYKKENDYLFAVIHRSHHDDWSFPKGKQDENETIEETAKREILEETGLIVEFEKKLMSREYEVKGKEKIVHYWLAKNLIEKDFQVNDEVDELLWLTKSDALKTLSYEADRFLLEEACQELGIK
ncbi:MAG: hypothetical protein RIQ80_174 [Actinomycetota bacterium]|jgi:8-oxo-dGTP diphosphatase|nr:NUDIX domain-containing protein [Actinomycetota bacterium]